VIWSLEAGAGKTATPEQRAALERRLNQQIARIADRTVQYHYQQQIRGRLRALFAGPRDRRGAARRPAADPAGAPPANLSPRGDVAALREQQERVLLSILINHNELVHGMAEELAQITLTNRELDRMLREILNVAVDLPELDSKGLQRHLIQCGHQGPLATVLNAKTYRQARVAAPQASATEAARVLSDIVSTYRRQRLAVDRMAAKRDLADEMTSENSERLLEIVREQTSTSGS